MSRQRVVCVQRISAHVLIMQEMCRDRDCVSPSVGHMLTEKHSVSSEPRTILLLHFKFVMIPAAASALKITQRATLNTGGYNGSVYHHHILVPTGEGALAAASILGTDS